MSRPSKRRAVMWSKRSYGYFYFDVFIGRGAALDVFPRIVQWLQARGKGRLLTADRVQAAL